MISTDNRPRRGAHLKLIWDRARDGGTKVFSEPPGLTNWDIRFLKSIERYPLPLSAAQRATLTWVLERAS